MIHVDLPAAMECEEKGCAAKLSVRFAMTIGGTFATRPPTGHGWQITVSEQGVLQTRCPLHYSKIERLTNADPGVIDIGRARH